MKRRRLLIPLAAGLAAIALAVPVMTVLGEGGDDDPPQQLTLAAVGSGFTYQGRLLDGGNPATGVYDLRFSAWDAGVAGTQQGLLLTFEDVSVTSGLFTLLLDFGAGVFTGAPRYLQMEVKPGASGAFTTMAPRQLLAPVPYAIYADTAGTGGGGFAFGTSVSGASPTTGFEINHTNTTGGNGVIAKITGGAAAAGAAIHGETNGTGVGVEGLGTTATGEGGKFLNSHAQGTALSAIAAGAGTSTALELNNGALKVSGSLKTAFQHTAAAGTKHCAGNYCTRITHPLTDGDPNAIVIVTQLWEPSVYNPHPVGVYYNGTGWSIFNEDLVEMPANAKFNVLVIKQ